MALLTAAGCGERHSPTSQGAPGASSAVIATVAGRPVYAAELDAWLSLKRIPAQDSKAREQAVSAYLEREALSAAIESQDLLDRAALAAELDEQRRQTLIARYFERFLDQKVDEQAVRNFYAANQDRYSARKALVAHILIRTNPKMSQAERDALLTKAQEASSKARAGEDFAALATQYSEDTRSAAKGGELGWLTEGAIDPAFSAAAFGLTAGQISQPVATPFGFHVIKAIEAPKVVVRPFESVAGDIRYELRQQAKQAELERLGGLVRIERTGAAGGD